MNRKRKGVKKADNKKRPPADAEREIPQELSNARLGMTLHLFPLGVCFSSPYLVRLFSFPFSVFMLFPSVKNGTWI